jgi:excinuclease ABC subunit A
MEIDEAIFFFKDKNDLIYSKLLLASNIGLGYLELNQEISTLSGGEAQRIKLLKNIDSNKKGKYFALDEPFQGLSNEETFKLMNVLYDITKNGNSIIIVEHNLLALRLCSYLLEFGPESGKFGGNILYNGRTDDIKKAKESIIKKYI